MISKSGHRFSEKIMLRQNVPRSNRISAALARRSVDVAAGLDEPHAPSCIECVAHGSAARTPNLAAKVSQICAVTERLWGEALTMSAVWRLAIRYLVKSPSPSSRRVSRNTSASCARG
jgi:hypothetical protein